MEDRRIAIFNLGGGQNADKLRASDFNRLYIVTADASGEVSTALMRSGKPFKEAGIK